MLKWTVSKRNDVVGEPLSLPSTIPMMTPSRARRSLGNLPRQSTFKEITTSTTTKGNIPFTVSRRRRSLGVVSSKKSLLTDMDKENNNCIVSPSINSSALICSPVVLQDVSNLTPKNTPTSKNVNSQRRKRSFQHIQTPQFAPTLPSFDIEYSPFGVRQTQYLDSYFKNPRYFNTPAEATLNKDDDVVQPVSKKFKPSNGKPKSSSEPCETPLSDRLDELRFSRINFESRKQISTTPFPGTNNNNQIRSEKDNSFSSEAMGDKTLDRMIDAILESARKEPIRKATRRFSCNFRIDRPKMSDIKTHFARTRATIFEESPTYTAAEDPANDLKEEFCNLSPEKYLMNQTIIIDDESTVYNEREVRTPDTVLKTQPSDDVDEIFGLKRQKAVRRKNSKAIKPNSPSTPMEIKEILAGSKRKYEVLAEMETPSIETQYKTSSLNFDDLTPSIKSNDLRASSTPTANSLSSDGIRRCLSFSPEFGEFSLDKRRSIASSINSKSLTVKGSIDLSIFFENDTLIIHVIRCRDLQRTTGNTINAYVKIALLPIESTSMSNNATETGFQRTAVQGNSSRPNFNHRFMFDLREVDCSQLRIQLAVWHRDRQFKRSEFLGCLSIPIRNVLKKEINGSFKLQNQLCLTNPTAVPCSAMCENSQSSVDEVVSLEEGGGVVGLGNSGPNVDKGTTIAFSKKAIHQRDADENLFLRFLELDPPPTEAQQPTQQSTPASQRRQSSIKSNPIASPPPSQTSHTNALGRTPFTITKRLQRHSEKGYGFSIVWTHPPRVEKVESNLPAEKAGILPGDFVIFVDKHNVVTMPEMDILNLIRSQGNALVLEIFRRPPNATGAVRTNSLKTTSICSQSNNQDSPLRISLSNLQQNSKPKPVSINNSNIPNSLSNSDNYISGSQPRTQTMTTAAPNFANSNNNSAILDNENNNNKLQQNSGGSMNLGTRSSIACSNASISMETTKRRLHLPQVTFSKESILPQGPEDQKLKFLYQLINREHHFVTALQFGMQRFMHPLRERKDLISPNDHRTLFQNIDELQRISEDILEQLVQDDNELVQISFASRVYVSKTTAICVAYKKYCNGLKRADCVLVNKSRYSNSEFMKFITEPQVPRRRPDLTSFIHRPLTHFREILKLVQLTASHCRIETEEFKNFTNVVNELQAAYREITVGGGLMEPLGEGRPLLTLQDLEARLVFTKCKPFVLASPGRQWVFGGDLSRVEGRSVKPYWALLFSDILLFAKVSRDRVLFITEEPLALSNIVDSTFNVRKKSNEFRIVVDPNEKTAESPTVHCTPDLTRTPKKNTRRYTIALRAPSPELKAVWQNLLQRQIFLVNATLGSTPLSSPLESPDIMQLLLPMTDIGAPATSMASIKLSSIDNLPLRNHLHHQQPHQLQQSSNSQQHQGKQQMRHIEDIIDEKCRILNKNGTPKGGALHLAQWMKGQFDHQQQRHRTLLMNQHNASNHTLNETNVQKNDEQNSEPKTDPSEINQTESNGLESEEDEECIVDWSPEQVRKRSRELKLIDANGFQTRFIESNKSNPDTITEDEERSKSPSRSTTSDSQITVRSSPIIANTTDTISVCRQCHKNCKSNQKQHGTGSLRVHHSSQSSSQSSSQACCQGTDNSSTISQKTDPQPNCDKMSNSSTVTSDINSPKRRQTENGMFLLLNGSCTTISSSVITTSAINTTPKLHSKTKKTNVCQCKCSPKDFVGVAISPDEIKQETCRIIENVHEIKKVNETSIVRAVKLPEQKFFCRCEAKVSTFDLESSDTEEDRENNREWEALIKLSPQKHQQTDPFEAVPSIAIVPPTPDGSTGNCQPKMTLPEFQKLNKSNSKDSPDDESPQCDEPPYKVLNTSGLRRYGTMSSLEKLPSEENDKFNSSDEDDPGNEADDDEIKIVTKEVFSPTEDPANASLRNWTSRAGSYMAEKMSFFEESRAFFDKYLGRWDKPDENMPDEDHIEECTSGATSGEDVWGTPTSGGENDEIQMFNSDQTHSSPTSSSFTGDDDTELMMDELLMAPPMTASAVRGLLPRRRLEPLFEEDTESGESDDENSTLTNVRQQGQVLARNWPSGLDSRGVVVPLPTTAITNVHQEDEASSTSSSSSEDSCIVTATRTVTTSIWIPPPPPTALLPSPTKEPERDCGKAADTCGTRSPASTGTRGSAGSTDHADVPSAVAASVASGADDVVPPSSPVGANSAIGLSPRNMEMRLALNRDIMGDEDLINYDTVQADLTTILGHDLSTYHRLTGRDLLHHRATSSSRVTILRDSAANMSSYQQQRNSKMDTPTPNRKKSSPSTWSSSASVDRVTADEKLSDLERLAKLEKMYCNQLKNGQPVVPKDRSQSSANSTPNRKPNKLISFLTRRNSENHLLKVFPKELSDDNLSVSSRSFSSQRDNEKPLDRRFWKQLSRRRRSNSVSEISAN